MCQVTLRGKVYTVENVKWAPAEPDVGIMASYVDEYELKDESGKSFDWDNEELTSEELQQIENVINQMTQDDEGELE